MLINLGKVILFFERKFSCQALHAQSGEKMIGNAEFRSLCEELRVHWVVGLVLFYVNACS